MYRQAYLHVCVCVLDKKAGASDDANDSDDDDSSDSSADRPASTGSPPPPPPTARWHSLRCHCVYACHWWRLRSLESISRHIVFWTFTSNRHLYYALRIYIALNTMEVLSPFIPVLCHADWLFHGESCPRLDVVHPGRAWSSSPWCTWHCSLHYLFLQATPLFPRGVTIVC